MAAMPVSLPSERKSTGDQAEEDEIDGAGDELRVAHGADAGLRVELVAHEARRLEALHNDQKPEKDP